MPRPSIQEEELAAIRRSVYEAARRVTIARSAQGRRETRLRTQRGYTKKHFEADALLNQMAYAPRYPLNDRNVMTIISAAAKRNDKRFFIRFGKVLAKEPKLRPTTESDICITIPPMQVQFLISRWVDSGGEHGELCRHTPEGLLAVLQHKFGCENVRMDVVGIVKL